MVGQTRDQQIKAVVEGLALGTLARGVEAVNSSKLDLEFAIGHALRGWSYADEYPSLHDHLGPNYVWIGIGKSEGRRGVYAAWRRAGRWLEPYVVIEGWSVQDCIEVADDCALVPHAGWVDLAHLFVDDLGEEKVRRS